MKGKVFLLLFNSALFLFTSALAQPKIIIKLDDLNSNNYEIKASPVLDNLLNRRIKASLGVIATRLDTTADKAFSKYINATNEKGEKLFEIWNHGFDHSKGNPPHNNMEFDSTSYDFQLDHFRQADKLVKSRLHLQMHTFGSPYNAADSNTINALSKLKKYKVYLLHGSLSGMKKGILYLSNRVDMETSTGNVNYSYFVTQYQKLKPKYSDYMVLQGHPNGWDAARLSDFNKILDFLISEGCEFVLPYDYYLSQKHKHIQ